MLEGVMLLWFLYGRAGAAVRRNRHPLDAGIPF